MTTPSSPPINFDHILNELRVSNPGRGLPITLNDSDVRALAGVPSGAIYFSNLLGRSSYTSMSASVTNGTLYNNQTGSTYTGVTRPSVSVSNGSGGYTYQWTITSGSGFTLGSSTSAQCTVSHSIGVNGYNGECYLTCVITDNTGHQISVNATCYYTNNQ